MNKFLLNDEESSEYSFEIYKRVCEYWDKEVESVSHLNISPDAWLNMLTSALCSISAFNLARVCAASGMDKAHFIDIVNGFCFEISENASKAFDKGVEEANK